MQITKEITEIGLKPEYQKILNQNQAILEKQDGYKVYEKYVKPYTIIIQ